MFDSRIDEVVESSSKSLLDESEEDDDSQSDWEEDFELPKRMQKKESAPLGDHGGSSMSLGKQRLPRIKPPNNRKQQRKTTHDEMVEDQESRYMKSHDQV